jgi:hypothetical protein
VAWTVHLEYEGSMLVFLLDIIEVPEVHLYPLSNTFSTNKVQSHTGAALGKAFQGMLECFGLTGQVHYTCV